MKKKSMRGVGKGKPWVSGIKPYKDKGWSELTGSRGITTAQLVKVLNEKNQLKQIEMRLKFEDQNGIKKNYNRRFNKLD